MAKLDNPYELLGLKARATTEDIKRAYRQQSLKLHPDKNKAPDAAQQFARLQRAYELLINDDRRKKYDEEARQRKEAEKREQKRKKMEERRKREEEQHKVDHLKELMNLRKANKKKKSKKSKRAQSDSDSDSESSSSDSSDSRKSKRKRSRSRSRSRKRHRSSRSRSPARRSSRDRLDADAHRRKASRSRSRSRSPKREAALDERESTSSSAGGAAKPANGPGVDHSAHTHPQAPLRDVSVSNSSSSSSSSSDSSLYGHDRTSESSAQSRSAKAAAGDDDKDSLIMDDEDGESGSKRPQLEDPNAPRLRNKWRHKPKSYGVGAVSRAELDEATRSSELKSKIVFDARRREELAQRSERALPAFMLSESARVSESLRPFVEQRPTEVTGAVWNSRDGFLAGMRKKVFSSR